MSEFDEFRNLIETGNYNSDDVTSPYYRRILFALRDKSRSPRDIAVLVRGALRHADETEHGRQILTVPLTRDWPTPNMWESHGVKVVGIPRGDQITIAADPWYPRWLPNSQTESIEAPLFRLDQRNVMHSVPGDPFLKIMNLYTYRSRIQRDAVRAVLMAPPGSTLIVNLPTGTGKSLLFQLPAILNSQDAGVTLVVVPTVALAIDQEKALEGVLSYPTAYYDSPSRKDVNVEIRKRIRDGAQSIVFTSPESVLGSLQDSLETACKAGYLRTLVIDEAHMISAWGDQFRPEFQELSGWRRHLARISGLPFKTLLLSATITQPTLDAMETLFAGPGELSVFSASQIRPEPSYWAADCGDEAKRLERLVESIHHLPRPLIVYTTRVADAENIGRLLRDIGYSRLSIITGKTKSADRESIIDQWKKGLIDIVVATSAFGLGVDQSQVRAVIHACIPESIDRFYQEVGRGGRDGLASLSLVLFCQSDFQTARHMQKVLIGLERGLERWSRMFNAQLETKGGWIKVPIDVSPSLRENDIDMDSDENISWNIRTLTLMGRAGLLRFGWESRRSEIEEASNTQDRPCRWVQILSDGHLNINVWDEKVGQVRNDSREWDKRGIRLMVDWLTGERCISDALGEMYDLHIVTDSGELFAAVGRVCNGCPYCRKHGNPAVLTSGTTISPLWSSDTKLRNTLSNNLLTLWGNVSIFYPAKFDNIKSLNAIDKGYIRRFFQWVFSQGIEQIVADLDILNWLRETGWLDSACVFFTDINTNSFEWIETSTLFIHPPGANVMKAIYHRLANSSSIDDISHIFFLPEQIKIPDPTREIMAEDIITSRTYKWDEFRIEVGI